MVDSKNLWPGWETVKLIGRGSFGAVYEIQRDMFGDVEKAALKVLSIPQNAGDIEALYDDGFDEESITSTFKSHLRSIIAEYSMMKKMADCVNIVSCDDIRYVQREDGIGWDIFIKMELLTPLTKAFSAEPTEEDVIKIAKDMCAALIACKEHGIVHRDIKPQNIFLSKRGDYKLGDFGIAKTVEKTMGGTKIGTYKYMAPEVYNNQPYGTGADIYSLGLVLYWLLNERRMPFMPLPPEKVTTGMDEQARTRRLSGEQIPAPAHGSDNLNRIVLKACAFDPKERYQSAAEMLHDLNEGFGSEAEERRLEDENRKEQEERERLLKEREEQERLRREREEQARKEKEAQEEQAQKEREEQERIRKEQVRMERLRKQKEEQERQQKQMAEEAEQRRLQNREERLRREAEEKKRARNRRPYYIFAGVAILVLLVLLAVALPGQKTGTNDVCAHEYLDATYTQPATCKYCGMTTGDVKGYIGSVSGYYPEGGVDLGFWYGIPWYMFDEPILDCRALVFELFLDGVTEGCPLGDWEYFARTLDGEWTSIGTVNVQEYATSTYFFFEEPFSFDAIAATRLSQEPASHGMGYAVSEVQVYSERKSLVEELKNSQGQIVQVNYYEPGGDCVAWYTPEFDDENVEKTRIIHDNMTGRQIKLVRNAEGGYDVEKDDGITCWWEEYVYDEAGNLISEVAYEESGESVSYSVKYEYDEAGNPILESHYDAAGNIESVVKVANEYDSSGFLTNSVRQDEYPGTDTGSVRVDYQYNETGNQIKQSWYLDDSAIPYRENVIEDNEEYFAKEIGYTGYEGVWDGEKDTFLYDEDHKFTFVDEVIYDEQGRTHVSIRWRLEGDTVQFLFITIYSYLDDNRAFVCSASNS